MPQQRKQSQRDSPADSQTAWFAVLERARLTDDYALAAKAKHELHRLGVTVKFRRLRAKQSGAGKGRPDEWRTFDRDFHAIQDAAKAKLGVDNWPHGCFHDLRKTFATEAAANGVRMHELQAHLGHSSITTTAEYYTEVEPSAADRLRAVFAGVA